MRYSEGYWLVPNDGDSDYHDGPYPTVTALAVTRGISSYPADAQVMWADSDGHLSTVPSLNPDDLPYDATDVEDATDFNCWHETVNGYEFVTVDQRIELDVVREPEGFGVTLQFDNETFQWLCDTVNDAARKVADTLGSHLEEFQDDGERVYVSRELWSGKCVSCNLSISESAFGTELCVLCSIEQFAQQFVDAGWHVDVSLDGVNVELPNFAANVFFSDDTALGVMNDLTVHNEDGTHGSYDRQPQRTWLETVHFALLSEGYDVNPAGIVKFACGCPYVNGVRHLPSCDGPFIPQAGDRRRAMNAVRALTGLSKTKVATVVDLARFDLAVTPQVSAADVKMLWWSYATGRPASLATVNMMLSAVIGDLSSTYVNAGEGAELTVSGDGGKVGLFEETMSDGTFIMSQDDGTTRLVQVTDPHRFVREIVETVTR